MPDNPYEAEAKALSDQKYRRLYESVLDGFVTVSMEGRVMESNRAYRDMLGYGAQELSRLSYQDLTPPRWHHIEGAIVRRQILRRGYSDIYEKEYIRKDGTVFPVELRTYLIRDARGKPAGMWAFIRDITRRKRTEAALQQAKDELEAQVRERTARLRELTLELTRTERRERRRLAHVLHEDLQQLLAAVKFRVSELHASVSEPALLAVATAALSGLDQAIKVSRSLAIDLRPPVLYELGLEAALDWLAGDLRQRFGLTVKMKEGGIPEPISDDIRLFAFEAIREMLLNVIKHAGIRKAIVTARPLNGDRIQITVKDRGRGFDVKEKTCQTFGILSIRERAEGLGGELKIVSAPGKGTCVTLTLPTH